MLIFNEVPGPFPWYDKQEKTNRFRKNAVYSLFYKLIAPNDALLPLQYKRQIAASVLQFWKITQVDTGKVIDLTENIALVKTGSFGNEDYFYYGGGQLTLNGAPLKIPYGFWESSFQFSDNTFAYSEMFFIPENSFSVNDAVIGFIKLEWYNVSGDVPPFYYSDQIAGIPVYRNVVYLDSFITASEPVLTQTTAKDGDENDIPLFQKVSIPYNINLYAPDFLKLALVIISLHDTINFTSADGIYSGQINSISTQTKVEAPGAYATVDLSFEQDLAVVNRTCSTNLIAATPGVFYNYLKATKGDFRISYVGGNIVMTDPNLIGKTGYAVYSQQDGNFINFANLTYDANAGSFSIIQPGYDIVPDWYIFVFFNLFEPTLP